MVTKVGLCALLLLASSAEASASMAEGERIGLLDINRKLEVLPSPEVVGMRAALEEAGEQLGTWTLDIAGAEVNGAFLKKLAATPKEEPLLRAAREAMGRPLDLEDFLYFLDDVLVAGRAGKRGAPVVLTPDRARRYGVFVHPDDVFRKRPRVYAKRPGQMPVDPPAKPREYPRPDDGALLGPGWTMRYANPATEQDLLIALKKARPDEDLHERVELLVKQLREQGAEVTLDSTVRPRERGYLMWGAFWLARAKTPAQVNARARTLERLNRKWGLEVPIRWRHPKGWRATTEAAREMAEAYNVVYATRRGAERSNHYEGRAIDCSAVNLPRTLTLRAPDGAVRTFDLSDPEQPRDLSLTPELVRWVEEHFGLSKLKADYPHWDDARVVRN